jgi:hypothetical protein
MNETEVRERSREASVAEMSESRKQEITAEAMTAFWTEMRKFMQSDQFVEKFTADRMRELADEGVDVPVEVVREMVREEADRQAHREERRWAGRWMARRVLRVLSARRFPRRPVSRGRPSGHGRAARGARPTGKSSRDGPPRQALTSSTGSPGTPALLVGGVR